MMSAEAIRALLQLYERHEWRLERVLISPSLLDSLGDRAAELFAGAEIMESDLDAAWFRRPSVAKKVAWELRALDPTPFALVEVSDGESSRSEIEALMTSLEQRLRDRKVFSAHGSPGPASDVS